MHVYHPNKRFYNLFVTADFCIQFNIEIYLETEIIYREDNGQ